MDDDRLDILVVEDDAEALEGVLELLELEGYTVAGARDGSEALGRLASGPAPSLVLLDLSMPVMDGWEFCRLIEDSPALSELPIAVFTGVDIQTVRELPDRRHDAGFIQKPVQTRELLAIAERYCPDGRA